jgi:hypothetical protein
MQGSEPIDETAAETPEVDDSLMHSDVNAWAIQAISDLRARVEELETASGGRKKKKR